MTVGLVQTDVLLIKTEWARFEKTAPPAMASSKFGPTMVRMTGADTPPILIVPPTLRLICPPRAYRLD